VSTTRAVRQVDADGGMSLAVVVPATDRPATLGRCLDAIRGAADPPDELIAVVEPPGVGPAAARNAGAEGTTAEIVAFVDSDVVVHADVFTRIRGAFAEAGPELAAIFGSYDAEPADPGIVSGFRNLLHHHVHQTSAGRVRTFWAGIGAMRRTAFLTAGGFDDSRYPDSSIEDIELGMRVADAGGGIELDPAIQGKHLKSWTLLEALRTDFIRRGVPWTRLLLERRSIPSHLNLGWRHRASAAASVLGIAAVAGRRRRAALAAALLLVALNRSFYALLMRRRGPVQAVAGVGLHALHHAVASASVVGGLVAGRSVSFR
jgi:GT2 family glycosyltransferase